jgi:hypothetical protein
MIYIISAIIAILAVLVWWYFRWAGGFLKEIDELKKMDE